MDAARVPDAALHRGAVDARRRPVCAGDMDRHQRRSLLPQRRWRRFHDVHARVGRGQHSQQGTARGALHPAVLHSRRRHAVVPRPDQQRPRELHDADLRRLGRTVCLAAVLRRDAAVVDAGRRLVSRPRQLARHGPRYSTASRAPPIRPRSGAGGTRSSTTSPRAWTGRSRASPHANHNPVAIGERPGDGGAGRDRHDRRRRRRPRRRGVHRS